MNGTAGDRDSSRQIKSVLQACEIIDAIRETSSATLQELSDEIDLSPGTLHTYLSTLDDCGYLTKEDGTYELGFRFITMGEHVRNNTDLYMAGQEEVDKLADKTGEYVHLVVENDGREVAIYERRGQHAVGKDYHSKLRESPQHLHDSAAGKAILSRLPDERVDEIIDAEGLERQTQNTITDRRRLREVLETVRERGYAINDEEEIRGLRAVGVPIVDTGGSVVGAVSVTGPTSRLKDEQFEREIPELVTEAANLIEVNLELKTFDRTA